MELSPTRTRAYSTDESEDRLAATSRPTIDSKKYYWDRASCPSTMKLSLNDLQIDDPTGKTKVYFMCWITRQPTQLPFSRGETTGIVPTAYETWRETVNLTIVHQDIIHFEMWLKSSWEDQKRLVASASLPPQNDFPPSITRTLRMRETSLASSSSPTSLASCELQIVIEPTAAYIAPELRLETLPPRARNIIGSEADWQVFDSLGQETPTERVTPIREVANPVILRILLSGREPELTQALRSFLFERHADDGLCFLLDIQAYAPASPAERRSLVISVINTYILDSSPRQISLAATTRKALDNAIQVRC